MDKNKYEINVNNERWIERSDDSIKVEDIKIKLRKKYIGYQIDFIPIARKRK